MNIKIEYDKKFVDELTDLCVKYRKRMDAMNLGKVMVIAGLAFVEQSGISVDEWEKTFNEIIDSIAKHTRGKTDGR